MLLKTTSYNYSECPDFVRQLTHYAVQLRNRSEGLCERMALCVTHLEDLSFSFRFSLSQSQLLSLHERVKQYKHVQLNCTI
jgi:hypothetical protein